MRFNYKNKVYELAELNEPNRIETLDIIAIFEVKSNKWVGTDLVECNSDECEFEKLNFVDYYYGANGDYNDLINTAKKYIDRKSN